MFEYCQACQENPSYGFLYCPACQTALDNAREQVDQHHRESRVAHYIADELAHAQRAAAQHRRIVERGEPWGFAAVPRRSIGANVAAFLLVVGLISIALLVIT